MPLLLYIGIFGFFGAISRYLLSGWVYSAMGTRFPWGTLVVNVLGSFILGFLFRIATDRLVFDADIRTGLTVGFLGAFTTFSTFSLETLNLLEEGNLMLAAINILASVTICIIAAWGGVAIARAL